MKPLQHRARILWLKSAARTASRRLLPLLTALLVGNALAWRGQGHQVVAGLAAAQLSATARAAVDRLLALEPGATLQSISTWPDEHRSPGTAPWHYVNFPRDSCAYVAARDCPDGNCVVDAITRQLEVLRSNAPDEARLRALKYLVHFAADIHQPLHAGHLDDRGGNSYQIQAFGQGSNLHELWDFGLISQLGEDTDTLTRRLLAKPLAAGANGLDVAHAAVESCEIVGVAGFYPARKLGQDYVERYTPVMEQRLTLAGARLARWLNEAFR